MSTHGAYNGPLSAFERSLPARDTKVHNCFSRGAVCLVCSASARRSCPGYCHSLSLASTRVDIGKEVFHLIGSTLTEDRLPTQEQAAGLVDTFKKLPPRVVGTECQVVVAN